MDIAYILFIFYIYFIFYKIKKHVFDYDYESGEQTSSGMEKETGSEIVISHQTGPCDTANR